MINSAMITEFRAPQSNDIVLCPAAHSHMEHSLGTDATTRRNFGMANECTAIYDIIQNVIVITVNYKFELKLYKC